MGLAPKTCAALTQACSGVVASAARARQLAERREAALAFDAPGCFRNDRQQAAHAAGLVPDGAVRQREPAVLQVAVAIEREQPVVDREGFAAGERARTRGRRPTRLRE